jgi:hypothetical protein
MAVTYQSIASASSDTTALVITKPTGLAVGDTMLAGIYHNDDDGGGGTVATPSGWTRIIEEDNAGENLVVFSKLADSSDVAASNFTFSSGGASYHLVGSILRISEFGLVAGQTSELDTNSGTATVIATGFTPSRANTLFVAFLVQSRTAGMPEVVSVAMATNNPSWTERAETQFNDSTFDSVLGVFTATRAEMTATGSITGTTNGSAPGVKMIAVLSISSRIDGDVAPVTYANGYTLNPIDTDTYTEAFVTDPTTETGDSPTNWQNETKPSTSWVNEK